MILSDDPRSELAAQSCEKGILLKRAIDGTPKMLRMRYDRGVVELHAFFWHNLTQLWFAFIRFGAGLASNTTFGLRYYAGK